MRDEHRFREKIELSLEKRHVAGIGIAVSLFLAAAFSLGVLVGKRLASRAAVPGPIDDLVALDAQQAPGRGRPSPPPERGEVTRPGTGTGSPRTGDSARIGDSARAADLALAALRPAATRGEAAHPGEATRPGTGTGTGMPQTTRPGTGTGGDTTRPGTGTGDTTRPGTGTSGDTTRPGTGTGDTTRPGTGTGGDTTRPGTGTSGDTTRPGTGTSGDTTRPGTGDRAVTRPGTGTGSAVRTIPQPPEATTIPPGRRTAEVAPPQTAILPAPPASLGKYTVQIGATQDRAEAHQMVIRVSKAGLRPYVMEAKLPGRGLWYRVRVGAFADRAAADQYRTDVERELRTPAVVMPSG